LSLPELFGGRRERKVIRERVGGTVSYRPHIWRLPNQWELSPLLNYSTAHSSALIPIPMRQASLFSKVDPRSTSLSLQSPEYSIQRDYSYVQDTVQWEWSDTELSHWGTGLNNKLQNPRLHALRMHGKVSFRPRPYLILRTRILEFESIYKQSGESFAWPSAIIISGFGLENNLSLLFSSHNISLWKL
jgi:hypothetical protein